jgi:hypothetical protein
MVTLRNGLAALVVGVAVGVVGCGDEATVIDARGQAGPAGGSGGGGEDTTPAFIVSTRVFSPEVDARTSYFYVVDSLDASTVIDPARGLEMPGSARLFANEETGWIAIGSGEDSTITRYTVGPDGLAAGDRINLQGYGITSHWSDDLYIVSPTKLYYPDRTNEQLLIINPEEMAIIGTIPLPETNRAGYQANYGYEAIYRDGLLLFTVGWFNWDDDVILGETGLVAVDTATDQVVSVDVDSRCGGVTTPVTLASGDTYLVASALAAANNRLGRLATEPCALRILAGEATFDASYTRRLGDLVGGALAGEPVYAGGDALYFRVFDESAATVEDGQFSWDVTGQAVWSWARWDVSEDVAVPDAALAPSTADVVWFRADDRTFGMESLDEEFSQTRLIELSAPGGAIARLTAPGFLQGVARAR